jgi:small subunit ribosomal protein S9
MADKKTVKKENSSESVAKQAKHFYAVGRRKTAIARVKLFPKGSGKLMINHKDYKEFFPHFSLIQNLEAPFEAVGQSGKFDAQIRILGGGAKAQSEACRLGIARCLVKVDAHNKKTLRAAGFMTRDPRAKERKKPGLKRARRAPQWSKR